MAEEVPALCLDSNCPVMEVVIRDVSLRVTNAVHLKLLAEIIRLQPTSISSADRHAQIHRRPVRHRRRRMSDAELERLLPWGQQAQSFCSSGFAQ